MKDQLLSRSSWVTAGLLVLAFAFRLPLLSDSFWLDEAAQALESARPLSQQLQIAYDFQPPLLHLIVHFALYFSRAEWWLRLIGAIIPGLVSIWATYQVGLKLLGKRAALLACLLLTTSSFHIFYSQELRPYALPMMFACLSWLVFVEERPKYKQYSLLTLLGLYSSYLYPFLILGQVLYILVLRRSELKNYALHASIWILGFFPWMPSLAEQFRVSSELRQALPGWDNVVSIEAVRSLFLVAGKFMFGVLDLEPTRWFMLGTLCFGLVFSYLITWLLTPITWWSWLVKPFATKKTLEQKKALLTVLIWLVVPLLSAWFISLAVPILHPKRVIYLLPAFYLLLAAGSLNLPFSQLRRMAVITFLSINLFSTTLYFTQPKLQRENWRQLYQTITTQYPTDTVAVFSFPEPFAPWTWYDDRSYPTLSTGTLSVDGTQLATTFSKVEAYQTVLVFDYLRSLSDPRDLVLQELINHGFQETGSLDQPGIGFVRIYQQSKPSLASTQQPDQKLGPQ